MSENKVLWVTLVGKLVAIIAGGLLIQVLIRMLK